MILGCDKKGCLAQADHLLDESDGKIYCVECGEPIDFPPTTVRTLRTLRQVRRKVKSGLSFTCQHCKHTARPVLKTLANRTTIAVCSACGKQMENVSPPFIEAIKSLVPDVVEEDVE